MNGKFILLLMLCINVMTLLFSYACETNNGYCTISTNNIMLGAFIDTNVTDFQASQGVVLNPEFSGNVSSIFEQQSTGFFSNLSNIILDSLRMILGLLAFLTPIPIFTFGFSLGFPFWVNLLIFIPVAILYFIAVMEFIRGGSGL